MTANAFNWLLTIVGTLASIVGLVFSWLAWIQAKGAKEAAEKAVQSVRSRETAYEFAKMATDAKNLLEAVQARQTEKAITTATELVHLLLLARDRRANFLPARFEFQDSIEHLQMIGTSLAAEGFPESPTNIKKLLSRCHQIHNLLCSAAATVDRTSEETA